MRLEITIKQKNPEELSCLDWVMGLAWYWTVVDNDQGWRILASGYARTEDKARCKAERAAATAIAVQQKSYTYDYQEEN